MKPNAVARATFRGHYDAYLRALESFANVATANLSRSQARAVRKARKAYVKHVPVGKDARKLVETFAKFREKK